MVCPENEGKRPIAVSGNYTYLVRDVDEANSEYIKRAELNGLLLINTSRE